MGEAVRGELERVAFALMTTRSLSSLTSSNHEETNSARAGVPSRLYLSRASHPRRPPASDGISTVKRLLMSRVMRRHVSPSSLPKSR